MRARRLAKLSLGLLILAGGAACASDDEAERDKNEHSQAQMEKALATELPSQAELDEKARKEIDEESADEAFEELEKEITGKEPEF